MIAFACPNCGHAGRLRPELAGQRVKCPACDNPFSVPTSIPQPPPAKDEPPAWDDHVRELKARLPAPEAKPSGLNRSLPPFVGFVIAFVFSCAAAGAGIALILHESMFAGVAALAVGCAVFVGELVHLARLRRGPRRTCPHCAEKIQPLARVCRFCGHQVQPAGVN